MTIATQPTQTATLFFDLTSVDGEDAFRTAIDGWKYKHVLSNLDNILRYALKHDTTLTPEAYKALENIRTKMHDEAYNQGVKIND